MTDFFTQHNERKIIELSGIDKANFLQGLITQDVNLLNNRSIIYGLILSPQGRFQFELFIIKNSDDLWLLDVESAHAEAILKKLQMYKLSSDVTLNISCTWNAGISAKGVENTICVLDPRHSEIGYRFYSQNSIAYKAEDFDQYQNLRLTLGIPEGSKDMTVDKSIPLEWNMDSLNAISFAKGCYIGQELTARTKHVGTVRKNICPVKFAKYGNYPKGCDLTQNGKTIGSLGSSNCNRGIALIHSDCDKTQKILLEATDCIVILDDLTL